MKNKKIISTNKTINRLLNNKMSKKKSLKLRDLKQVTI